MVHVPLAKLFGMVRRDTLYEQIMAGRSDASIRFAGLVELLKYLGFEERIRGDHHIFARPGVREIISLQPKNGKAKVYQVRQIRALIRTYQLGPANDK